METTSCSPFLLSVEQRDKGSLWGRQPATSVHMFTPARPHHVEIIQPISSLGKGLGRERLHCSSSSRTEIWSGAGGVEFKGTPCLPLSHSSECPGWGSYRMRLWSQGQRRRLGRAHLLYQLLKEDGNPKTLEQKGWKMGADPIFPSGTQACQAAFIHCQGQSHHGLATS